MRKTRVFFFLGEEHMIKRERRNLQMIRKFKNRQNGGNKATNRPKGNFVETQAAAYLIREGYQVIARNYAYCGGELDIVAKQGETIVFVEVKSVWNAGEGNPAARVNAAKQKKIWKTACHFLHTHSEAAPKGFEQPCRFDVLSARMHVKPVQFEHFKGAFESTQVIPQC
jgi:putative endonuclease